MASLGLVNQSLVQVAFENIAFAKDVVRPGTKVNADWLGGFFALACSPDDIGDESDVVRDALDADSVTRDAGAPVIFDGILAKSISIGGVAFWLITEENSRPPVAARHILDENVIRVLVTQGDSILAVIPGLVLLVTRVLDAPAEEEAIRAIVVRAVIANKPVQRPGAKVDAQFRVPIDFAVLHDGFFHKLGADSITRKIPRHAIPVVILLEWKK